MLSGSDAIRSSVVCDTVPKPTANSSVPPALTAVAFELMVELDAVEPQLLPQLETLPQFPPQVCSPSVSSSMAVGTPARFWPPAGRLSMVVPPASMAHEMQVHPSEVRPSIAESSADESVVRVCSTVAVLENEVMLTCVAFSPSTNWSMIACANAFMLATSPALPMLPDMSSTSARSRNARHGGAEGGDGGGTMHVAHATGHAPFWPEFA